MLQSSLLSTDYYYYNYWIVISSWTVPRLLLLSELQRRAEWNGNPFNEREFNHFSFIAGNRDERTQADIVSEEEDREILLIYCGCPVPFAPWTVSMPLYYLYDTVAFGAKVTIPV